MKNLSELREEIDQINLELLELLNRRAAIVKLVGELKDSLNMPRFDPRRESEQIQHLVELNQGPIGETDIKRIFKEIFRTSLDFMDKKSHEVLLVHRKDRTDTIVQVGDVTIGGHYPPVIIAGPCSVESERQLDTIASHLSQLGVKLLRGGAFKPRTSPYAFQGMGFEGLTLIKQITRKYGMYSVSEVLDPRHVEKAFECIDVFQVGARNMHNYELLKVLGETRKPILLKRGFMSTLEELLLSAEYIMARGNSQVILCERGIRTFEPWTRNTLDISAVPIIKNETHLPIIVDISHSTGRKDIAAAVGAASLAAGCDGIMVEVHHQPEVALSDTAQQLNLEQFNVFFESLLHFLKDRSK